MPLVDEQCWSVCAIEAATLVPPPSRSRAVVRRRRPGMGTALARSFSTQIVEGVDMESRVNLFGHPVHQMLIVFPLGLLGTSVVFDLIHLTTGAAYAATVAFALIASGLVGGLLAAPFGFIDWLAIPKGTRA